MMQLVHMFNLKWFQKSHPNYKLGHKEKYVLQMFMNMQGNKQASCGFYKLLTKVFATIELFPRSVDSAIFAMSRRSNIIIVSVQTDGLLFATNSVDLKDKVLNNSRRNDFKVPQLLYCSVFSYSRSSQYLHSERY